MSIEEYMEVIQSRDAIKYAVYRKTLDSLYSDPNQRIRYS